MCANRYEILLWHAPAVLKDEFYTFSHYFPRISVSYTRKDKAAVVPMARKTLTNRFMVASGAEEPCADSYCKLFAAKSSLQHSSKTL